MDNEDARTLFPNENRSRAERIETIEELLRKSGFFDTAPFKSSQEPAPPR